MRINVRTEVWRQIWRYKVAWLEQSLFTSRSEILLCREEGWLASSLYQLPNDITVNNRTISRFVPLHGAVVFTKLDLRNAYHLVLIREGDEWKTTLNTRGVHWHCPHDLIKIHQVTIIFNSILRCIAMHQNSTAHNKAHFSSIMRQYKQSDITIDFVGCYVCIHSPVCTLLYLWHKCLCMRNISLLSALEPFEFILNRAITETFPAVTISVFLHTVK